MPYITLYGIQFIFPLPEIPEVLQGIYVHITPEQEDVEKNQASMDLTAASARTAIKRLLVSLAIVAICVLLGWKNQGLLRWSFFIAAFLCFIQASLFIYAIKFSLKYSLRRGYVSSISEFFYFLFRR